MTSVNSLDLSLGQVLPVGKDQVTDDISSISNNLSLQFPTKLDTDNYWTIILLTARELML